MSALDSLKAGTRVKILDTSADCPKGEGVIVADMSLTSEEYEVEYSNGAGTVYGLFYRSELEPLDTSAPANPDPIPRRHLVTAVLDGKTVQWKREPSDDWEDLPNPKGALICILMERNAVRLKPDPVERYTGITKEGNFGAPYASRDAACRDTDYGPVKKVLRVELDPDTLAVITAVTEAP
jgi:hypothetical protein